MQTTLIHTFLGTTFSDEDYDPAIEDEYQTSTMLSIQNGRRVNLTLIDPGNVDTNPGICRQKLKLADAFLMCFSLNGLRTLEEIPVDTPWGWVSAADTVPQLYL
jgi:GTPase SAR1 family protein